MLRVLSLLLLVQLCVAQQLEWPKQYTAKGQIILPYGDIVEPFTAYVDMSGKGRSRIDYYGGNLSSFLHTQKKVLALFYACTRELHFCEYNSIGKT